MMRPTRWWWGLMCVATLACGDEGPLAGPTARAVARDLEFVLPVVRADARVYRQQGRDSTDFHGAFSESTTVSLESGSERIVPKIYSTSFSAAFQETELVWSYGIHGFGNGYSIQPNGKLLRASDLHVLLEPIGGGAGLDWLVPTPLWANYSERTSVAINCGLLALFSPRFEMRVSITGMKYLPNMSEWVTGSGSAQQPACPSSVGFTGNGVITTTTQYKICYYDVWIDSYGNIVDILPLGCYPLQT